MKFAEWKELLLSTDILERCEAADSIPDTDPEKVIPLLVNATKDAEENVRLSALDSLGYLPNEKSRKALRKHSKKSGLNSLERSYALHALAKIGEIDDLLYILDVLKKSKDRRVKLYIILGAMQGLLFIQTKIIKNTYLKGEYSIKISACNLLEEQIEEYIENLKIIGVACNDQLNKDTLKSEKAAYKKILSVINSFT